MNHISGREKVYCSFDDQVKCEDMIHLNNFTNEFLNSVNASVVCHRIHKNWKLCCYVNSKFEYLYSFNKWHTNASSTLKFYRLCGINRKWKRHQTLDSATFSGTICLSNLGVLNTHKPSNCTHAYNWSWEKFNLIQPNYYKIPH